MGFSTEEIEKAIISMGVPYERIGPDCQYKKFCSFRKCQDNGIYFVVDDIATPKKIQNSLFICSKERQDLIDDGNTIIIVEEPQNTFYKLLNKINPKKTNAGIHKTAVINNKAIIEKDVEIGPYCTIGDCIIKSGTCLRSHVAVYDKTIIENNVTIESFTCVGATGAAWSFDKQSGERILQPQMGGVVLGQNSFIGSNITIVRGSLNEDTEIGENCIIAHGTKIGHGCSIGDYTHFSNNVTVPGNVDIGSFSFIGAGAIFRPQVSIGERTIVAAGAVVVKSVLESDCLLIGVPAKIDKTHKKRMSGIPKSFIDKRRGSNE